MTNGDGFTFSTIQELVPPQIRGTVVGFYLLGLNLIGLGFGITGDGTLIDALAKAGHTAPHTMTLLTFTVLSFTSVSTAMQFFSVKLSGKPAYEGLLLRYLSYAEMQPEGKNAVSHRGKAIKRARGLVISLVGNT